MKKYAIIVAGGSGVRMGGSVPKQFLPLHGKPILHYTIKAFLDAFSDIDVIVVLPQEHLQRGEALVASVKKNYKVTITCGGATRFNSVKNGLHFVSETSIVFVHDGVRCLVSKELIQRCYHQALEQGSAIPAVAATDSIRLVQGDKHNMVDRNNVRAIQTPQTFQSYVLLSAFEQPYQESFTDEATVVEAMGTNVYLIDGDYNNLKVTRPIDLLIAEKLLEEEGLLKQA